MPNYYAQNPEQTQYVRTGIMGKKDQDFDDLGTLCALLRYGGPLALNHDERVFSAGVWAVDFDRSAFVCMHQPNYGATDISLMVVCMHCRDIFSRDTFIQDRNNNSTFLDSNLLQRHLAAKAGNKRCTNDIGRLHLNRRIFQYCEACGSDDNQRYQPKLWSRYNDNANIYYNTSELQYNNDPYDANERMTSITLKHLFHTRGPSALFHRCITKLNITVIRFTNTSSISSLLYCLPTGGNKMTIRVLCLLCGLITGQYTIFWQGVFLDYVLAINYLLRMACHCTIIKNPPKQFSWVE